MIRRALRVLPLLALPLAGCASQYHPPVIRYDDAARATRLPDPPKPVQVVEVPRPLPLPRQLKPLPVRRVIHPPADVPDPTARITQANLAARIQPTRAGFINAVQVYPYSPGALYQVYTAPSTEAQDVDAHSSADGLAGLPSDYVGKDVLKLGPALPGDLGHTILKAQEQGKVASGGEGVQESIDNAHIAHRHGGQFPLLPNIDTVPGT